MKKNILLMILFPIFVMGQATYTNPYGNTSPPIQVNVTQQKNPYDFSDAIIKGAQAGAANAQAGAAARQAAAANSAVYNEAMKDNYSKISVDNLINNTNNYDYVVVESISGWSPKENKKDVLQILNNAKNIKYLIFHTITGQMVMKLKMINLYVII